MLDLMLVCEGAPNIDEQETSVCIDHQTKRATIYSSRPQVIEMLRGWLLEYREETECIRIDRYGIEVSVPAEWVRLRAPKRRSAQWKEEARERLAEARAKRWEKEPE